MTSRDRRLEGSLDRRRVARGGRRKMDRAGRHPFVLIADSYEGARVPCARCLQHLNFRVDQAADGEEALALVRASRPHLIIAEERLPVLPASRLKQSLAEHPRTRQIPIIVAVSDFNLGAEDQQRHGMAGVLVKPFPLATMIKEVRRVLRARTERF